LNNYLNYLAEFGAELLRNRGYNAIPLLVDDLKNVDMRTLACTFQHKTVATMAGMGWIGKSALLVTEEYGPNLRINTILTDAMLDCGTPLRFPVVVIVGNVWKLVQ
jgi:epoxyqueuosine reductase